MALQTPTPAQAQRIAAAHRAAEAAKRALIESLTEISVADFFAAQKEADEAEDRLDFSVRERLEERGVCLATPEGDLTPVAMVQEENGTYAIWGYDGQGHECLLVGAATADFPLYHA